ncbi:hypothetical protein OE88DRAFT_1651971 [Heliocybe sulcata]|uniref:Uncharacterized protein n=1 Tax=Heliocybe sulcata TaxID=5364 RepID=A0A5C3NFA5_9AGAM|nr:hypothetical protein OE88DRAFT_1651971 [Heliocybe sulcata]
MPLPHVADPLRSKDTGGMAIHAQSRKLRGPSDLRKFLESVSRLRDPVTSVEVEILEANSGGDISWFDMSPLYQYSKLQKLDLVCPRMLPATDDDVLVMLTAWPNLRCLILNPKPQEAGTVVPRLTFRTLDHVARYGTKLEEAAFFLHPGYNTEVTATLPSETLRALDLGLSPGHSGRESDEVDKIVLLLNGLFPRLEKFSWL